ncbi:MAG: LamG-like jellyroll fold domain-containing protein [Sedimentisphaerales bacterium]|nr:LamG-like jellyroll fold domain-containing protein [Sedimentisphaerales bacterium]
MCKKLFYFVSIVLVLNITGNALAQFDPGSITDGNVYLFENVSTDVPDESANSNTANLVGNPQVVDGLKGKALQFNGVDDGVHIPDAATINLSTHQNHTVVAIFKCADVDKPEKQVIFDEGGTTRGVSIYVHEGLVYVGGWNLSDYTPEWTGTFISAPISSNAWYAVAMVLRDGGAGQEDDKFEMWMDGVLIGTGPGAELRSRSNDNGIGYANSQTKLHDGNVTGGGNYFEGTVDEIWIINAALTQVELSGFAGKVWPYPSSPSPADAALVEDTWINLAWRAGGLAASHDVYFGENFDDVNDGAESVFQGNQTTTEFIAGFPGFAVPEGLVPGTTYYWRIDEVNEAEPNSPWKGDVWSFTVPPMTAYNPDPADGAKFIETEAELSWTGGFGSKIHHVYFSDNFDDVNSAAGALPNAEATYTPAALELDKTYYWRVDEFDGSQTIKGNVWSFKTMPDIPVTDPNLICWWTLEEGSGTRALDWSGHGNHGDFIGEPKWVVDGYDGAALNFDGTGESVISRFADETWTAFTLTIWAKADELFQSNNSSICSTNETTAGGFQFSFDALNNYQYHADVDEVMGSASLNWVHLAVAYDGIIATAYYNGEYAGTFNPADDDLVANKFAIGVNRAEDNWFDGSVDEFRVYNRSLTQEEIQLVMRGDPMLAWLPSPTNGSLLNLRDAGSLSWSPGDNASEHDVYFGIDKDAVSNADVSDTSGVYRGRQGSTSFNTTGDVEWGGGPYYWRIDEANTDGTVSKGRIWTFTVADFIVVDDFESYNDLNENEPESNRIYLAWIDGFDNPAINGSVVGNFDPPFAERTIVHSGSQSMPLAYDNAVGKSEATLTLTYPRDWTENDVGTLVIWYYGNAANAPETMYVILNGTAGVDNDNPDAVLAEEWTEWRIDLQMFADQGVNLSNVNTITIGFGNRSNPVAGGTGTVFFDDIRLYRPAP